MTLDRTPSSGQIPLAPGVWVPAEALRLRFSRSSGPGGQNVNKLNTKSELWVPVGAIVGLNGRALARLRAAAGNRLTLDDELHLTSQASRSQEANREEVFRRLREMILQARVEPKIRRKTKPSKASKQRRLESKRRRGEIKARRRGARDE